MGITTNHSRRFLLGLGIALAPVACKTENKSPAPSRPQPKTESPQAAAKSGSSGLQLGNTKWGNCLSQGQFAGRNSGKTYQLYSFNTFSFSDGLPTGAKNSYKGKSQNEGYYKDESCSKKISPDEVEDWEIESPERLVNEMRENLNAEETGVWEVGPETNTPNVYELDVNSENNTTYLLVRVANDILELSNQCRDESQIKEGLCRKIDGDSPSNRAKTFKMYQGAKPMKKIK